MIKLLQRISWLESNTANKWEVNALEAKVKTLQQLVIKAGLVEKYVSPLELGNTAFHLNDELYTIKEK